MRYTVFDFLRMREHTKVVIFFRNKFIIIIHTSTSFVKIYLYYIGKVSEKY